MSLEVGKFVARPFEQVCILSPLIYNSCSQKQTSKCQSIENINSSEMLNIIIIRYFCTNREILQRLSWLDFCWITSKCTNWCTNSHGVLVHEIVYSICVHMCVLCWIEANQVLWVSWVFFIYLNNLSVLLYYCTFNLPASTQFQNLRKA